MREMNSYHVSFEKEWLDTLKLIEIIKADGWIEKDTVIVNCSPMYSSRTVDVVNHKLSFLNRNELYEQIPLEMPYPNMSQIYNMCDHEFQLYDRYLLDWGRKNIVADDKILFISSSCSKTINLGKIRIALRPLIEPALMRFASLYVETNSTFIPDYYVERFEGRLLFEWQNSNNPNWK